MAAVEAEAEAARLKGNERFRQQDWAAAERAYRESLRLCPSAPTGSNLTAALLKLDKNAEAVESADVALGLAGWRVGAAVRAKLHYRRGLALAGLGRNDGAIARAFTAAARECFMKEISAAALRHEAGMAPAGCDLTTVPCVRKLSDAYFDRIARIGNTTALHACRSRTARACVDAVFAAGKAGDTDSASVGYLFAGCGDFRNIMATIVEVHSAGGVSTIVDGDLPHEVKGKALRGPPFKMSLAITMNDLCAATLARNVALMAIAAAGPAADAPPAEQLEWTYYLLAVWGNRTLFPVQHNRLRQLLQQLVTASCSIESFRESAFSHFVNVEGGPGEPVATLEQLRTVWRGWLIEPRSAMLSSEEQMESDERRSAAQQMRRKSRMMGIETEPLEASEDPELQEFFEYHGYLMLSKETRVTLSKTEAGRAALIAYDSTPGPEDGKTMNPTLCDHGGSGKFLDAQGPFKAFDPRDNEMEQQLFGCEPWGVPPVATVHIATCPAGAQPGDTFPVEVQMERGPCQLDIEVPESVQPGDEFEFEVAKPKNFLDALLLRMTHMRRVFRSTTTDARQNGMRTTVYVAVGDAFAVADSCNAQNKQYEMINLSNIGDYSGLLACLLWYIPLLKTANSVLQIQTMLGTHQTQDEWIIRQTGGSFTAMELDTLLGLTSDVIREHGVIEIEYRKMAPSLELWAERTLPMVREKLLALFGWISDGQQMPMGQMITGLMQGRCLGSTCTGTFVNLLRTLCAEASEVRAAAAMSGLLDTLIGNDGHQVDRVSPGSRRCVALLATVAHTLKNYGRTCLSPSIDLTFAEMMDPIVTLRCVVTPFSNRTENFVLAGSKEPMLLAVLTKGKLLNGTPVARLQGVPLVEAMKTADANCTQLVDTLLFNQFTRTLTMAVPRSLLAESKDSDPWQVQLLDIIDWHWASNPVVLSSMNCFVREPEHVSTKRSGPTDGPSLAEMMTGCAENAEGKEAESPRCEVCRCSAEQAATKAAERGAEIRKHFEGGLREGYCCNCYDKLVEDIKKKKAQVEQAAAGVPQKPKTFATPAIGVAKSIKTVDGVSIWGDDISTEKVELDSAGGDFDEIPTPWLLGVPLVAKRVPGTCRTPGALNPVVRLMSDPTTGLAPVDWQCSNEGIPKVLLARGDGKPFTVNGWAAIDDYMVMVFDDDDPSNYKRRLTKKAFGRFLHGYHLPIDSSLLDVGFPKGVQFQIQGVQSDDTLNGMLGTVSGWKANGRVKVKIAGNGMSEREIALKPHNLRPQR